MKILYCNKYNFPFSGTEAYLFDAMELMRSKGHEVALFSMVDDRGSPTPYDQHFVRHVDFKSPQSGLLERVSSAAHAIYSTEARSKLQAMIQQFRPDVAHVRNIYHHLSPSIFWELKAQHVPILYHLNDFKMICPSYNMVSHGKACEKCQGGKFWNVVTERCYEGPAGSRFMLAAEAYVHKWLQTYERCVDRILAPSHFVKAKLTENGWDGERIEVLQHFQKVTANIESRAGGDDPICYFGRLSVEKGLTDLLQAMRLLPKISLIIAGSGPQRGELERMVADLGLANVTFAGQLDRTGLERLIGSSRFTVLPTHAYETMGKSILESFAGGRAVIASDLGSRRELIQDGKTGLLFRVGDVAQLAAAISRLYGAPDLAFAMGKEAREYVDQKHSPEAHCARLLDIYSGLVHRSEQIWKKTRPLRVAFIGGRGVVSKYSGVETYYEQVGEQLARRGHEVTIYCRSYFTPALQSYHGLRLIRLPTIRTKHLETWVHTFLSTLHVMFSGCDIVHYHALGPALFSFLPRCAGTKTVVTVQGLDWRRSKWNWMASAVLHVGEKAANDFPNATITVSRNLHEHYRSKYLAETFYVPNGTVIRSSKEDWRLKQWGLESGKYILFLGRLSPEKNCHLLIQAFENLKPRVKLVLAGGSSYSDSYADELRRHQSDQIRVLNFVSGTDLDELLTNACLFVLPSSIEGLSLAMLDAMGAGVCVLASDIPENREVVDEAGYTFKAGDVQDLERMLRLLIENPALREAAAIKARERIQQHYLWPQVTQQIEQVYLRVLNRKPPTEEHKSSIPVVESVEEVDSRVA